MRTPTDLDAIAEAHVDAIAAHDPISATDYGIPGYDHLLPDFSPGEMARWADHLRDTLRKIAATPAADDVDKVTSAAMTERLGLELEAIEEGDWLAKRQQHRLSPADGA